MRGIDADHDTKDAIGNRCAAALRFGVHEFASQYAITSDGRGARARE